jgi:DUF1680 family protein
MEAHPLVEENRNLVAVMRGPLVYCIESHDLPEDVDLDAIALPDDISLTERYDPDCLDGVVLLEGSGRMRQSGEWDGRLYRKRRPKDDEEIQLRMIPYYAWDNRGMSEMSVWFPSAG